MSALRYLQITFVLLVLSFCGYAAWSYQHMASRVTTLEGQTKELSDFKASAEAATAQAIKRSSQDTTIRTKRAATVAAVEKATHEDSSPAAECLYRPLPDSLRNAHRQAESGGAVPSANHD